MNRILKEPQPEFSAATSTLAPEDLRLAMRHQASEVNRLLFNGWGFAQIPLALLALWLAWSSGRGKLLMGTTAAMLAIVLVLGLYVVPETVRLGRLLDFLPRAPEPPESEPFWRLHNIYTTLDLLKLLLAASAAFSVIRRGGSRTKHPEP